MGSITSILGVISLVATLACLVVLTSLHLLPTGYSPVLHAVSDYAFGNDAPLFRSGLYMSSLAVLAVTFALIRGVGSPPLAVRKIFGLFERLFLSTNNIWFVLVAVVVIDLVR